MGVSNSVLIVDGTGSDAARLTQCLSDAGYDVAYITPDNMPRTISELCRYGLVVLANVNDRDLYRNTNKLLDEYVSKYGRSVLTIGGENAFVYGGYLHTAFEDFLPVRVNVTKTESDKPAVLMLVIDSSASMSQSLINYYDQDMSPLDLAKRGAIKSAALLHRNDYIGVVSFSDDVYVMQEITSARNQERVITAISRMKTTGGTQYYAALQTALEMLEEMGGDFKRHIIFLSDGNAGDSGYESLVAQIAAKGITLSTIAVGNDINNEIMEKLASIGGGSYFKASDPYDLPSVMLSDTVMQQIDYTVEKAFVPRITGTCEIFDGLSALPEVKGYIRTEAKNEAQVLLEAENGDPILAKWRYGEGMSGAFMSDAGAVWAAEWIGEDPDSALLRILEDLMPDSAQNNAFDAEIINAGTNGTLRVTSNNGEMVAYSTAEIKGPGGEYCHLSMAPAGNGVYEQVFPLSGTGKYDILFRVYNEDGSLSQEVNLAAATGWSPEYEAFPEEKAKRSIENVCVITGGKILSLQEAAAVDMSGVYVECEPAFPLCVVMACSLLAEMILRRINKRRR